MLKKYELIMILDPGIADCDLDAQVDVFATMITDCGGEILLKDVWGSRPLAYKINKQDSGIYVMFVFNAPASANCTLDRQFRIHEKVMRHMIVLKDKCAPDMSTSARDFSALSDDSQESSVDGDFFTDLPNQNSAGV